MSALAKNLNIAEEDYLYLDPTAREEAAALPPAERQSRIKSMLIRSPAFNATIAALEGFHMPVKGGRPVTGKICGILGQSRVGKSWAIGHYVRGLGNTASESAVIPRAVYIDVHDGWTSSALAKAAHVSARLPAGMRGNVVAMLDAVADEVAHHGVELVIIDDIQFLLGSDNAKTRNETQGFLKSLADKGTCNVILSGTHSVRGAIKAVDHLHGRGAFPVREIPSFDWSNDDGLGEFGDLLDEIDDRLPFRQPSDLSDPETAAHLYRVSAGLIGFVKVYVEEAADLAIADGADRIEVEHLHAAAQLRREAGDHYDPFRSRIDLRDPLGERRAADIEATASAREPSLEKRRPRKSGFRRRT